MKNPQYEFIKNKYLKHFSRPSFSNFCTELEEKIIEKSASIPFETSLQLQNKWITFYNNVCTVERPKTATATRALNTSAVFKRVYIQAKALKNARAQVSAASLTAIGDRAESSSRLLGQCDSAANNDPTAGNEEEEGVENDITEEEEDAQYAAEVRRMATSKLLNPKLNFDNSNVLFNSHDKTLSHILKKKAHIILQQSNINHTSTELLKLSLSNILNFTHPRLRDEYRSIIPPEKMIDIEQSRQQQRKELKFDYNMNLVIDGVMDELKLSSIKATDTDILRKSIDELKYKEDNKRSSKYQVLNVVEMIAVNLRFWNSTSQKSEFTYLRKFEGLLEVILDDTELMLSDGESVSTSTRDNSRSNLEETECTEYGRRIDLLVYCARSETTVELCSIEFKKEDACNSLVVHQQSKNSRVNSCILSSINSLTKDPTNQILAFDFAGNTGYMTQLYCYEDVFISQRIEGIHIPTHILELDDLRNTLKYIYLWKAHLLELASKVIRSLYKNKRKYALIETSDEVDEDSSRYTPPPIPLKNVFMTPHRSKV